jgi:hypothetical protein
MRKIGNQKLTVAQPPLAGINNQPATASTGPAFQLSYVIGFQILGELP